MAESLKLESFVGQKAGMTRIFDEKGNSVPVTVVKLIPNVVSQVKTADKDGYSAYQVAFYEKRANLLTKPVAGQLKKAGIEKSLSSFKEIRVDQVETSFLGQEISLEDFTKGTYVDVSGVSKGKGFQGVMKRHGFAGGPAAHGSNFHRRTGSIGNRATPGRVWKLRKMPGHMGVDNVTVQNLLIVDLNVAQGYMLIKGSVPGGKNGFIEVSKSVKMQ